MPDGSVENCGLDIEMNVPRDPTKCTSDVKAVKAMDLIGQGKNCGFRILNMEWQETVALPISFIDTPEYNLVLPDSPEGAFRIGMITGQKEGSPEWSGIELQDVFVHVCHSKFQQQISKMFNIRQRLISLKSSKRPTTYALANYNHFIKA